MLRVVLASRRLSLSCVASVLTVPASRSVASPMVAGAVRPSVGSAVLRQAAALVPRGGLPMQPWMRRSAVSQAPPARRLSSKTQAMVGANGGVRRAFAGFKVYKGRGALQVSPIRPSWRQLEDSSMALDRPGVIFLEFAPSLGERSYDWNNKLTFAMNATEVGTILETPGQKLEFFHDPGKGGSAEGSVSKVLRVEPTPDGNGYFFGITMSDKAAGAKSNLVVPVSLGEFGVLKALFSYSLPHMLGFDEVFNCTPQMQSADSGSYSGGYSGSYSGSYSDEASPGFGIDPAPSAVAAAAGGEYWQQYGQQVGAPYAEEGGVAMDDEYGGDYPPFEGGYAAEEPVEEEPVWQPSPDSANAFGGGANNAFGERPPF